MCNNVFTLILTLQSASYVMLDCRFKSLNIKVFDNLLCASMDLGSMSIQVGLVYHPRYGLLSV